MAIIKIDEKDYDTESLSDEAKAQLQSLQFVDQELAKLNAQAAWVVIQSGNPDSSFNCSPSLKNRNQR